MTQEELDRADGCEGSHPIGSPNPCEFNVLMEPGATLEALPVMDDVAAHIARHDPARVLAEVAAKRTLTDRLAVVQGDGVGHTHETRTLASDMLEVLAVSYAGHPDYSETWKP